MIGEHTNMSGLHLGNPSNCLGQKKGGAVSAHIRDLIEGGLERQQHSSTWAGYTLNSNYLAWPTQQFISLPEFVMN